MRQKVSAMEGVCPECRPPSGNARGRAELRHVARADGAVAVPVGVGVVAGLPERLADGALGEGGVGLVDPAVAVDVLGGEVAGLAVVSVGVVCDAEGEGARPADGRDDAELVIREVRGLDEVPPSAQVARGARMARRRGAAASAAMQRGEADEASRDAARDDARRSFGQPSSQSMSPEVWGDMIVRCTLDRRS